MVKGKRYADLEDEEDEEFSEEPELLKEEELKEDELLDGGQPQDPLSDLDLRDNLDDFDMFGDEQRMPPMEKHSDLLRGLTKFSPFIKNLYNNWLGITWDEVEKKFSPDTMLKPIMNKIGANWHASFIQTYVRENNILAHLDRDEYYDLLEDINRTLLLTYAKRTTEFGFTSYSDVIRVWNEVEDASLLALSGAGGGKYSDFLGGGIVQYRGSYNENQGNMPMMGYPGQQMMSQQKKGFFRNIADKLVGNSPRQKQGGYR